jgi:hypothetical protein
MDSQGGRLQGDITVIEAGSEIRVSSYETDSQGSFSFSALAGQSITVVAKADGYISSERQVSVGVAAPRLVFSLSLSGQVSGRVIDQSGKAVPEAIVRVRYPGRERLHEFRQEIAEVPTDDYGYFTVPFVERRTPFILDVAAPGRSITSSLPMTLTVDSMAGVLITVSGKTQPVRGKVLDSSSQPIAGASVHLRWIGKGQNAEAPKFQANRFASTGRDGSFEFQDIPEGDIVLVARQGGSRFAAVERSVTASAPLDVVLTIR